MKLNIDLKNKVGNLDADFEKIIENSVNKHDKNWKDKFSAKQNAKKEMLILKHKHKMEIEENKTKRRNLIQILQEENRKNKEQKLQQQLREEQERIEKEYINKRNNGSIKIWSIILTIVCLFGLYVSLQQLQIFAGIVSVVQVCLFVYTYLICLNIVPEKTKNSYILLFSIGCILIIVFMITFSI